MALSNQSDLPAFFSPQKVNLKISINSGLQQARITHPRKMALGYCFHQIVFRDLGFISHDLANLGKSSSFLGHSGTENRR
jgi:hypothetical protein